VIPLVKSLPYQYFLSARSQLKAWTFLAGSSDRDFAKELSSRFPQAARFAVLGVDYICKATQLPPEFKKIFSDELMRIQMPK